MLALYAAVLITLLPARPTPAVVRVDWSDVVSADPEIAALRAEYVAAVNAGDAARATALHMPNALTALCDGTVVRGAGAIGARITTRPEPSATVTLHPRRFSSSGTVASETGSFIETLAGSNGAASVEGVYVTVYSRQPGGQWRIAMEVRTTGRVPAIAIW
jgi:ketosteroid isomerase-like protein